MPLVALHRAHLVALLERVAVVPLIEVGQEALQAIGEGHRVGVEDDDVLGARIHVVHGEPQRAALVAIAVGAVEDLETGAALPALEDLARLVGRVVDQDDFVVLVVEGGAALQQPLDHPLLVVGGDLDRDEGLMA